MYFIQRHTKGNNDFTILNSKIQRLSDKFIQAFLDKYDNYELSDEFKEFMKEHKEVFVEKPLKPDLVIKNQIFNKNKCFYEANLDINNYFPRKIFQIDQEKLDNNHSNESKNTPNNINNTREKQEVNIYSNSQEMMNACLKSNMFTIKGMVNMGTNPTIDREKDNQIIDLIKSNGLWIIQGINATFNSLDLFEYMTKYILSQNINLNNYIVYNKNNSFQYFEGGYLYICLMKYLPLFISQLNVNNNINYNSNNYRTNQFFNNNTNDNNINNMSNYLLETFKNCDNENLNFGFNCT